MIQTKTLPIKLLILFIFFLGLLRFVNLNNVPIFADEAIFLSQAEKIVENPRNFLISLEEDQFPVITWVLAAALRVVPAINPLFIGRTMSISADLLTAFLIFLLGQKIGGGAVGLLSMIFYLSFPLNFFHSRLVLLESLTNFFALLTTYFILLATTNQKPKSKYLWGIFISSLLAFFTKPLAIVSILPALFIPVFFSLKEGSLKIDFKKIIHLSKNILVGILCRQQLLSP